MRGDTLRAFCSSATTERFKARLLRFGKDEDGSMVVLSVFFFVMMVMVTGVGVDLMRYERDRSKLQATLDRAVLAAADLDQERSPTEVVTDYFEKAGFETAPTVVPDSGIGYKTVYASSTQQVHTTFMSMVGIDYLQVSAEAKAEERIDGVEISMVLDISGSMGSNSRLTRLKPAAREFVNTVIDTSPEGKVSISVVPYATQVNAGETLLSQYKTSAEHDYSHCVNFTAAQFQDTSLDPDTELELEGHFDVNTYSEDPISSPVCLTQSYSEILPLSGSKTALHNKINSLQAGGMTSTDLGIKWGMALLDPDTNDVVKKLITAKAVSSTFTARPASYNDGGTLKVLVVMSDGQNTSQYQLADHLRSGDSNVWYNDQEDRYSIKNGNSYWYPHNSSWNDAPYGNGTEQSCTRKKVKEYYYNWRGKRRSRWVWRDVCTEVDQPGTAERMSYPELWAQTSLAWNAEYNYTFDGNRWNNWYNGAYDAVGGSTKDNRMNDICDAAKDEGVVIFTVGFEAPQHGQNVLQSCASSDSHHFDVDGLEIEDAFAAIAASIRKLRLTQ